MVHIFFTVVILFLIVSITAATSAGVIINNHGTGISQMKTENDFFPYSPSNECDECVLFVEIINVISKANGSVPAIVKFLENHVCDSLPLSPHDKQVCDSIATDLAKILPALVWEVDFLYPYPPSAICSLISRCKVHCCLTQSDPEQIHLGLTENSSTIVVQWTTLTNDASPYVSWAVTKSPKKWYQEPQIGVATTRTYTEGGWVGYIHTAFMSNLLPGTSYTYTVGSKDHRSSPYTFTTILPDKPLRIAVYGDMGAGSSSNNTIAAMTQMADSFDMIWHIGDTGYADGYQARWDIFLRKIQHLTAVKPILFAVGNHELPFNFAAVSTRLYPFTTPDKLYYSLDIGDFIHLTMINTETTVNIGDINQVQHEWISKDLKSYSNSPRWKIVGMHRPLYCLGTTTDCTGETSDAKALRDIIEKDYVDSSVNLVFTAHRHNYQVTYPLAYGQCSQCPQANTNGTVFKSPRSPIYNLIGTGGNREGPEHRIVNPTPDWNLFYKPTFGFGILNVHNSTNLSWSFYGVPTQPDKSMFDTSINLLHTFSIKR